MDTLNLLNIPLCRLTELKPMFTDFLISYRIDSKKEMRSFPELLDHMPRQYWDDIDTSRGRLLELFIDFARGMEQAETGDKIESVEILAGIDKSGNREQCNLLVRPGEVTCIVGPTGSGKSRLLADIEWMACADTPTKRVVLVNGKKADTEVMNMYGGRLIAQITQNMNFVLDMNVNDFLLMHAQSRFIGNAASKVDEVIAVANELSGEGFDPNTPVTFLSGGQSRALMISDVACIGQAPIVLIDEIENAGVDKRKALELLVNKEKIVFLATHDPMLILLADKRVVIRNGGMEKILVTNKYEKTMYQRLEKINEAMQLTLNFFRAGNQLSGKTRLF
jgi:ABC-type lipoprotein export system ATPase subunit